MELILKQYFDKEVYQLNDKESFKFNESTPGYTITTDKAVYRPGETILIQIYFYNKYDKTPYEDIKDFVKSNPKVVLRDGKDEELMKVKNFTTYKLNSCFIVK